MVSTVSSQQEGARFKSPLVQMLVLKVVGFYILLVLLGACDLCRVFPAS